MIDVRKVECRKYDRTHSHPCIVWGRVLGNQRNGKRFDIERSSMGRSLHIGFHCTGVFFICRFGVARARV